MRPPAQPPSPRDAGGASPGPAGEPAHEQALETALTAFEIEIARLFLTLPANARFLLAGGAALLAQHLTARPTQDLDLFTSDSLSVATARNELEHAVRVRGWTLTRMHGHPQFCRLIVHGHKDMLVDLALDAAPQRAGTASFLGPAFAPEELAARELLAPFDRAEVRAFADVYVLAQRYG